jgi:hypothetical protein
MLPWLVFSFMGILDLGFSTYALISLQNAARVAAIYASSSYATATDTVANPASGEACQYALAEMRNAPNVGSSVKTCSSSDPVQLSATLNLTGSDGTLESATVSVSYTLQLLAIPGILPSQISLTRKVEFPLRG